VCSDLFEYKVGDALRKARESKAFDETVSDREAAALFCNHPDEVELFSHYRHYHAWCAHLIQDGRRASAAIDQYQGELRQIGDKWFDSRNELQKLIVEMMRLQFSIHILRDDMFEFLNIYTMTDINQKVNEIAAIEMAVNNLENSFSRIYSSAQSKLDSISNSRVTLASFVISITALAISVLGIWSK